MTGALFPEEVEELKEIGVNQEDINVIDELIIKYPVKYEIIRRMLLLGVEVQKIKEICINCSKEGIPICYLLDNMERVYMCRKSLEEIIKKVAKINFDKLKERVLKLGVSLNETSTLSEVLKECTEAVHRESKAINHRKKNKELKNWQHNKFWQK